MLPRMESNSVVNFLLVAGAALLAIEVVAFGILLVLYGL